LLSSVVPSWLLKAKVTAPEPGSGHVARDALLQRLGAAIERRFALLQAPAGFGKTTVLADLSRRKRDQGAVVAWISLDEDDSPSVFGDYLAYAFECAGLDLSALDEDDAWPSSPAAYQIGTLARALDRHAAACLVVLDEVDRLPRETVELLQRLVERGPGNLHFALAFRSNPGLDLAMQVFDGSGVVVGAGELRFSRAEIARFLAGSKLSRRQLDAVEEQTAGWPVALTMHRNQEAGDTGQPGPETARLTSDFVRLRLLRGLSDTDRRLVCELAVFDRIDPDLVDEVLGAGDARARIAALSPLEGLLAPIGQDGASRRMHPLVRDCCADLLAVEDPARKRWLHASIATVLARRGQFVPAWRHARSAGDARLVGELVERAGVFEIWLRHGVPGLLSANELLTPEITALHPRLMLLRSVALRIAMKVDEAEWLYESIARSTEGFAGDWEGGDADAPDVDRVFAQVVFAGGSHLDLHDEIDTLLPAARFETGDERGRLRLGARHMVLCASRYERARFDECRRHAALAKSNLGEERRYGEIVFDVYLGMAAMAEGRVREAANRYGRARRITKQDFASDSCLAVCVDAVAIELDIERDRKRAVERRTLESLAVLRAIWTEIDAVALAVVAELTFEQHGGEPVISLLTKTLEDVRAMRSVTLSRCVSGLLVHYLVESGRTEQAAEAWRQQALPTEAAELVDLDGQPWRTMESMACARVRLLAAQGDLSAADEVATALCTTASERGLARTLFRGLALSMVVAERAGDEKRALSLLVEFQRLAREADYVRPLVRHREVSSAVLRRLLATQLDPDTRDAAEALREHLDGKEPDALVFSARELEVLAEVREGRRNMEIAGRLGISRPGVRFHLMNIYRKTGVNRREEAVRAAQALGVLD